MREVESPKDILITVTRVETTPDLGQSKVFIGVIPEKNIEKIIESLNRKIYRIQQKMNKRLKMKYVPKIKLAAVFLPDCFLPAKPIIFIIFPTAFIMCN